MLFAQVVLRLLLICYPLSTFGYGPKDAVLAEDIHCYGGGIQFESELYPMIFNFKDYHKKYNGSCLPFNEVKYAEDLMERKVSLEELIEKIIKDNKCPELTKLLKTFKKVQKLMWNYPQDIKDIRNTHIAESLKKLKSDLHLYQAAIARKSNMCGGSDMGVKMWPYWDLIVKLKETQLGLPTDEMTTISESGETANDCRNVRASGSEDLRDFYVKLPRNKVDDLNINFEAYGIKDQIIVYGSNGQMLYDSSCTSGTHSIRFNKDEIKYFDKIKVEVVAKCAGDHGTAWDIQINCKRKPVMKKALSDCDKAIQRLVYLLDKMLKLYQPIQNHYWNQVLCYYEYEQKLKKGVPLPETELEIFRVEHKCVKCKEYATNYKESKEKSYKNTKILFERETEKKKKFYQSELLVKRDQIETSQMNTFSKVSPHLNQTRNIARANPARENYKINKAQFDFDKKEYCKKNKRQMELFDKVSKRYCMTAYERLLEEK